MGRGRMDRHTTGVSRLLRWRSLHTGGVRKRLDRVETLHRRVHRQGQGTPPGNVSQPAPLHFVRRRRRDIHRGNSRHGSAVGRCELDPESNDTESPAHSSDLQASGISGNTMECTRDDNSHDSHHENPSAVGTAEKKGEAHGNRNVSAGQFSGLIPEKELQANRRKYTPNLNRSTHDLHGALR